MSCYAMQSTLTIGEYCQGEYCSVDVLYNSLGILNQRLCQVVAVL